MLRLWQRRIFALLGDTHRTGAERQRLVLDLLQARSKLRHALVESRERLGEGSLQRAVELLGELLVVVGVGGVPALAGLRRKLQVGIDIGAGYMRAAAAVRIERDE